ncbi:MAG TPA: hypothetical protein VLX91_05005 [Candidatus Acidoferrales bacterium]|nr:hypothetical protein [Candidatus Acidoferrales bacterium]
MFTSIQKHSGLIIYAGCLLIMASGCGKSSPDKQIGAPINRVPHIDPDYAGIVIPPNIAPLNFRLIEEVDEATLQISSAVGDPIELSASDGSFFIPMKEWKRLLSQNAGKLLVMKVHAKKDERWYAYRPIVDTISNDPIDPYLAYRLINPAIHLWRNVGLYQRNIETFEETPILTNKLTDGSCMNCHNFKSGDPQYMMMHIRGGQGSGTLIRRGNDIRKVNTATSFNRAGAYPSWHPNGNIIAFSVNKLSMFFHAESECRDVLDAASDIVLYLIDQNMITTCPDLANPDRMETFPCWSPDGKYLYFCSTSKLDTFWMTQNGRRGLAWRRIRYDLMRIPYDAQTNTWGKLETVLSAEDFGGSITEPRVSPDGRFVLFTGSEYSNFPIYLKSADLYLFNLETKQCKRLECNSDETDSFHSWSRNGRWFVFSSKRDNELLARPYFSHLDSNGVSSKPFILPQEDPNFYGTFLKTYNVPEMVAGHIDVDPREWAKVAMDKKVYAAKLDPKVKENPFFHIAPPRKEEPDIYQKSPR